MPRVLLTAAHIAPLVLSFLEIAKTTPQLALSYPPLPEPFHLTRERLDRLQGFDVDGFQETWRARCAESAKKPFCNIPRSIH